MNRSPTDASRRRFLAVAAPSSALSRPLASSPLRFYGKYSYGMYVIHALMMSALLLLFPTDKWMAAFADRTMLGSVSLTFVKIAICTVLAIISFHCYEMPFLRLKRYFTTKPSERSGPANLLLRRRCARALYLDVGTS